jgi:hypothetical protein
MSPESPRTSSPRRNDVQFDKCLPFAPPPQRRILWLHKVAHKVAAASTTTTTTGSIIYLNAHTHTHTHTHTQSRSSLLNKE